MKPSPISSAPAANSMPGSSATTRCAARPATPAATTRLLCGRGAASPRRRQLRRVIEREHGLGEHDLVARQLALKVTQRVVALQRLDVHQQLVAHAQLLAIRLEALASDD